MNKTLIETRLKMYRDRLTLYLQAEQAILEGAQNYTIGSRTLTRADLGEIRKVIPTLISQIEALESELAGYGRRRVVRGLPRDI